MSGTENGGRSADLEEQVGSTPTGYQQRLTATEAAALVRSWLFGDGGMAGISPLSGEFIDVRCQGKEFNESSKEWIVSCDLIDGSGSVFDVETYSLNDATGEIQQVS